LKDRVILDITVASVESGGLFSPSFTPIGSSKPDTNSLLRSSLDSSPEYQLSLESPLSVFSLRSVSHTPRTIQPQRQQGVLASTYTTNTAKAKARQPVQVQSSPSPSMLQQYAVTAQDASFTKTISTTSSAMGFAGLGHVNFGVQEQKYHPGLHNQVRRSDRAGGITSKDQGCHQNILWTYQAR